MSYDIGIIKGDGIGPEVIDAVLPLIKDLAQKYGFNITTTEYNWGSERYLEEGAMMPGDGISQLESHDSLLLGAVGHPGVPDHITLHGLLLPIRKEFDQLVCKRPSILFEGIESPLRGYNGSDIEFVVFRENTEGEYSDMGGREHRGFQNEVAVQTSVFTRRSTEAIVREAFETAIKREGKVTSVTKSNAQAHSMVFWDDIVNEVHEEYPQVELERLLVDAASMDLVRRPEEFDVIVASNLFGDILTDIGAIVSGSMGLAPSANINPSGKYPSMFEPVHGSAPDIVDQNVANPIATILSVAMLFDHLGESRVSNTIRESVSNQLSDTHAPKTPDIGGSSTTEVVVEDLRERF